MNIHPTAIVDKRAELGANVSIGPFCVVEAPVTIGENTRIGPHVIVLPHTSIGAGCSIHAHAVLGDLPQDLTFKDAVSYVRLGANCTVREGVTIHRGTKPETETITGEGCFLMANSHLAHNVRLGKQVILANGVLLAGYVEVGDRAFISGNAGVHQFCRVGKLAMVGAGSVLTKDLPPFCTVRSVCLNAVAGLNVVGLRRAGYDLAQRQAIKRAFHTLYQSSLNVSQATAKIRQESPAGVALELCEFVEQSKRGICRFEGQDEELDD
ncbi:MAG: acyl-ACP--UDP-N-acetylglucosamine O-acyltransferase [Lentisphaerae bacterium]|nr:acyl-ACP--UDP-N-acetylglucosamine O-acyltransferase [Lentisphaerota bacterium]